MLYIIDFIDAPIVRGSTPLTKTPYDGMLMMATLSQKNANKVVIQY